MAHVPLLIGHFPIGGTSAPSFSIFKSAHVLVACSLLNKRALAMSLILRPGSFVDVAILISHLAFGPGPFACHIRPVVGLAIRRNVRGRWPVVQAFKHRSGVKVSPEDISRNVTGEGLNGMIPRRHPQVPRKLFWVRELAFGEEGILTRHSVC